MKPRITVLTLGVDDLERALRFYRDGVGLKTQGIVGARVRTRCRRLLRSRGRTETRTVAAHEHCPRYRDPAAKPASTEFTIGHNVSSRSEVDAVMERASGAGAEVVKPPARYILGWLFRIFQGSGWACLGSRVEPSVGFCGMIGTSGYTNSGNAFGVVLSPLVW